MNNNEILKKAIKKAGNNGWSPKFILDYKNLTLANEYLLSSPEGLILTSVNSIIFSHDFAKAFFGKDATTLPTHDQEAWEYHLQQMVLEEDPIRYLEMFL